MRPWVHALSRVRAFAPLFAVFVALVALLGCSENTLSDIPKADTDEPEIGETIEEPPIVVPDIPPPPPSEPVADAGPNRVYAVGSPVTLDGSGSYDPDGLSPLVYAWTLTGFPSGSSVQIAGLDSVAPTFTADVSGAYTFDLTVQNTAGVWDSTPASVRITAEENPVLEPVANAGPDQTRQQGSSVQLDGTASFDPQGLNPLVYQWQIVQRPTGSTATLSDRFAAQPIFTTDRDGTYLIELTVRNTANVWDSSPDQVVITAFPAVQPPVSHAGLDIAGSVGTPVQLNGTGSTDPQGLTPLVYAWTFTSAPPGTNATLSNAASPTPTFTPDLPGTYVAELAVRNTAGLWDPTPDKVDVVVTQVIIQEPIADAGADFGVLPLETVSLSGAASWDPAGLTPLAYQWSVISVPAGSTAMLSDPSSVSPSFFADLAGDYVFELTVRNSAGVWDTTPDRVTVTSTPIDGMYVEVSWDNTNDLDIHVLNGTTPMWGDGDVCYCNMNPSWGGPGAADDPSLDHDAIYGYGPETVTIDQPANGTYEVKVHYYGLNGSSSCGSFSSCPSTTATVNIYLGGVLAQSFQRVMTQNGQVWTAATIAWPSGAITPVDTMSTTTRTYCL